MPRSRVCEAHGSAAGERVTLASLYHAHLLTRRAWRGVEGAPSAAYELAKPLEPEPPMPESQRVVPAGHVHGDVTGKAREVMDVITAWMLDNRMRVDQNEHYYSGKAWDARREQWGGGAVLVVTHDGGDLYDVLAANYGHRLCDKFEAHLTAELTRLGLRFERITSWATGIYKD